MKTIEQPTAYPAPLVAHALHDDSVDRDIAKDVHYGLPTKLMAEQESAIPLGCRWRVDRTRPGYPPRISRVVPPSEVPLYNP